MSPAASAEAKPAPVLPWIVLKPLLPLWYLGLGWSWWRVLEAEATAATPPGVALPPGWALAALALCGKVAAWIGETGTYALIWRALGRRLPFWRVFAVVVSASMADLFAQALGSRAGSEPPGWLPAVAGLHLAHGTAFAEAPGVRAALGSLGLLTLIRIAMTAGAQARALGARWMVPLAVTIGLWLVSRAVVLFAVDLVRGMSPVGGG